MRDKKGQFSIRKSFYWSIAGVVIVVGVFVLALQIASYVGSLAVVSPKLKAEVISLRFANSPDCFAYQDEFTGRVFSGTIDLDKFNDEQMKRCYATSSLGKWKTYNFLLELRGIGGQAKSDNWFKKGQEDFVLERKVRVKTGEDFKWGELVIKVNEVIE